MNTKIRPTYYSNNLSNLADYSNPPLNSTDNVEYDSQERNYIFISSSDRDISKYPSTSDFRIDLPSAYQGIESIELAAGTIPNVDNVSEDAYMYLWIDELNHITTSRNEKYFGVLSLQSGNSPNFYNLDKSSTNSMPNKFMPEKSKLNSLHIRVLHPDRTVANFGTDIPGNPINFDIQTSFTFEIRTRSRKRAKNLYSDYRNIRGITLDNTNLSNNTPL